MSRALVVEAVHEAVAAAERAGSWAESWGRVIVADWQEPRDDESGVVEDEPTKPMSRREVDEALREFRPTIKVAVPPPSSRGRR